MEIQNYVKPELLVLIPVLYFIGMMMKSTKKIDDRGIPAVLGCCGVVLALIYVIGNEGLSAASVFSALTQGILVAGCSVYVNQIWKQANKGRED